MRRFGLIGKTLKHSFSKNYFTAKFKKENIGDCVYDLFELPTIHDFPNLIHQHKSELRGLNVTIPYKKEVMPFLDSLDQRATAIQAVNAIKVMPDGRLKGYNTDYDGFRNSLEEWNTMGKKALILGTGGASNAIRKVLEDKEIIYQMVSRNSSESNISYQHIQENPDIIQAHQLIINTTPLGTFPNVDECPDLPFDRITDKHLLFDLVYNPEITSFMKKGLEKGALVKNGYPMLVGQAEAAWKIWNE